MNFTEKQILDKAKKILQDLQGKYFEEENVKRANYNANKALARPRGTTVNAWTAVIDEPVFDSSLFLTISDETGEPLYLQSVHMVREIEKNSKGVYIYKS